MSTDQYLPRWIVELRKLREMYRADGRSFVEDGDGAVLAYFREQVEENQALFDLQWTRMGEATALWRAEDPGARELIQPDLGALLTWLMERGGSTVPAALDSRETGG